MSDFDPVLWRTASLVRQQLLLRRRTMAELYLPHSAWAHAHKLVRQLQVARTRGWERTVPVLRDRLTWQLEQLHNQLDRVGDELAAQRNTPSLPTVLELVQELRALAAEFEEFQCQPRRGVLRVTTPSIVLQHVDLGPFQIELEIKGLSTSQFYRIIALEPNPAFDNPSVTHPHVQNQRLCEGDGHQPIQTALAEGRLLDFFLIVQRLLSNYGQGKAYVELSDWQGEPCQQCGARTDPQACFCSHCEDRLCDDCCLGCTSCGASLCSQCIGTCAGCQESFCSECLSCCPGCQEPYCAACLASETCPACRPNSQSLDPLQESNSS